MAEDETTFLCGYKGLRRYGTTSSGTAKRSNYSGIIQHRVLPSDTLQGIALKYGASTTEIKRVNKLWSNDSIHLREILHIPILSGDPSSPSSTYSPQSGLPSATGILNGRDSSYDSMSENEEQQYCHQPKPSISDDGSAASGSFTSIRSGTAGGSKGGGRTITEQQKKQPTNNYDKSDCSIKDLLSRIDSSIKTTASNVKRLEKQSTIDQILDDSNGSVASTSVSTSYSRHSLCETSFAGPSSPPDIRTEVRRPHGKYSMRKLQEVHDQLYQL